MIETEGNLDYERGKMKKKQKTTTSTEDCGDSSYQELRTKLKNKGIHGKELRKGKRELVRMLVALKKGVQYDDEGNKPEQTQYQIYGIDAGQTNPLCITRTMDKTENRTNQSPKVFFFMIVFESVYDSVSSSHLTVII